ncbi:glycosyltransferase involved in cell wall biosynthesis [Salegentibacter sp. 24]|nr:glycosyltransferase involved in cell wall biosynthesis [Salegentibacter sp. 24]
MISIFAPHFFNWTEQLKDSGHEVYWIDVFDSNTYVEKIDFIDQIIGWKNHINYPGRYWIKKNLPGLYGAINRFNQRDLTGVVEEKIKQINPDIVQSFVLQSGAYPILSVMKKYPEIKWVFSAWGNDLFFRQQNEKDLKDIKNTLPEFDYMFADCNRDYIVARNHGFKGKFLGAFPGGGGYDLHNLETLMKPLNLRKTILIKGYQGKLGRCNRILEAVYSIKDELANYSIIIFGDNNAVSDYLNNKEMNLWPNLSQLGLVSQEEVLHLMGQSIIYIGNSISDGMPNTLLEAIVMGAFPIQSNPGGATAEIVEHAKGGFLIENPEDPKEIRKWILKAVNNHHKIRQGIEYNLKNIRPELERKIIRNRVLEQYSIIEEELKN